MHFLFTSHICDSRSDDCRMLQLHRLSSSRGGTNVDVLLLFAMIFLDVRRDRRSRATKRAFSSEFPLPFFSLSPRVRSRPCLSETTRLTLDAAASLVNSLFAYKQREQRSIFFSLSPLSLFLCLLRGWGAHARSGIERRVCASGTYAPLSLCAYIALLIRAVATHACGGTHTSMRLAQPPRHRDACDPSPPFSRPALAYTVQTAEPDAILHSCSCCAARAESQLRGASTA